MYNENVVLIASDILYCWCCFMNVVAILTWMILWRMFWWVFLTGHAVLWLFCDFVGVTLLAVDFVRMTVVENRLLLRILGLQIRYSVFCSLKLFVLLWEDIVFNTKMVCFLKRDSAVVQHFNTWNRGLTALSCTE